MTGPRDGRTVTHYIGDGCPGGHPELLPAPGFQRDIDYAELVGEISNAVHIGSWATRAVQVRDLLHGAGIHTGENDDEGRPVQSDWRDCPSCCTHPERHADGAS